MATIKADSANIFDDRGYSGRTLPNGQTPANAIEKGLRERIETSLYWKESCFGLNEATICDAVYRDVNFVGGTYGLTGKPTPFACLLLKLLSLVPEKDIILEYLNFEDDPEPEDGENEEDVQTENEDAKKIYNLNANGNNKYLRLLAAMYVRLAWEPVEVYKTLEPLLLDFRRVRRRTKDGFVLANVDSLVDTMLTDRRLFGTSLAPLSARSVLEDLDLLEPRESPLQDEVDAMDEDEDGDDRSRGSRYESRSRSRSYSQDRDSRSRSRSRHRSYTRSRSRSRSPRLDYRDSRSRSRTRSREYRRRRSVESREGR